MQVTVALVWVATKENHPSRNGVPHPLEASATTLSLMVPVPHAPFTVRTVAGVLHAAVGACALTFVIPGQQSRNTMMPAALKKIRMRFFIVLGFGWGSEFECKITEVILTKTI
jgi:hypothetical protein